MSRLRATWRRLVAVVRYRSHEAELDEELRFHFDQLVDEYVRGGCEPEEARRLARLRLGGEEQVKESVRDDRGLPGLESVLRDLRLGARRLLRQPSFTSVVVITLGLALGASVVVFSLLRGVVLRPLPYPEPDRLVRVFETRTTVAEFPVSPLNLLDFRNEATGFQVLAGYTREDLELSDGGEPLTLAALRVTPDYFEILGARPAKGRVFEDADTVDAAKVLLISDRLWRTRFATDPDIVGKQVQVNGAAWTVLGVLPAGFQHVGGNYRSTGHGETVDAWWPIELSPEKVRRNWHYINVVGRLADGVQAQVGEQELIALAAELETRHPETNRGWSVRVESLHDRIVGGRDDLMTLLAAAVTFLVIIGCVNVAHLLFARSLARRRELAIASALGAGRGRLRQQMLVESLLLSAAGGVLGLLLGWLGVGLLLRLMPSDFPRLHSIQVDGLVVLFTFALSAAAGLLFGIAQSWRLRPPTLAESLSEGGRTIGGSHWTGRRGLLVALEVALATALVVGGGLLLRSLQLIQVTDWGFDPEQVLTFEVNLPQQRYADDGDVVNFYGRLGETLAGLPGVESVGGANYLPWTGWDENTGFGILDDPIERENSPTARYGAVHPGYFEALGTELVAGRLPAPTDDAEAPLVVTVNQRLVEEFVPHKSPHEVIGQRLSLWGNEVEIVGVVGDIVDRPGDLVARSALFWHFGQRSFRQQSMVLRVEPGLNPTSLSGAVRRAVGELDPLLPVSTVQTLEDIADANLAERRFLLSLVGLFSLLAVVLAAVGVYGVLAYSVHLRRRDLGIRMALGAAASHVCRLVLGQGLAWALVGLVAGLGLAALLSGLLESLIFGIAVLNPPTYGATALLILGVCTLASGLPAIRAAVTDPLETLREE
ncbi:MAG: ABC transporter permease [Thermoanaerobaculia bacterium]|nr:ABC transporter permease [Thermoanaerobaculia bacterium]